MTTTLPQKYQASSKLTHEVSQLIETARQQSLNFLYKTNVHLYWHIGDKVNQNILQEKHAQYGTEIIKRLASELQTKYCRGVGQRVIGRYVQFAKYFPNERVASTITEHLK